MTLAHAIPEHLMAAVIADPHDDTPRLIVADWLDENDQHERAEFIRVQIEWARQMAVLGIETSYFKIESESDREMLKEELRGTFPDAEIWQESGLGFEREAPMQMRVFYRRGFVDEVRCRFRYWAGDHCKWCVHGVPINSFGLQFGQIDECDSRTCRNCEGLWRAGGFAKQVCERWPLTKVKLTDIEIHAPRNMSHCVLRFQRYFHPDFISLIEKSLSLKTPIVTVSDAAILMGRRLAGLGPIATSS